MSSEITLKFGQLGLSKVFAVSLPIYLAAILDAMMDIPVEFRLSDYQGTIYLVLMDY